ncbi:MAG TPA: HD domain-containing protein [Candidatus Micrarchaeia archaeon]|nr:HD domain-containing protein [Candidatus Micrarchaeia archaeon]
MTSLGAYDAVNLLADPLYGYCEITKDVGDGAGSEQAILDHPWLQRLRKIHQLQSAWWVFHTAEHSRFQHVIGVMHLSGDFARHLYPGLRDCFPDTPSPALVEETMRIAGLCHDIGHGPFGHFFDQEVLRDEGLDHEVVGRAVVLGQLADRIACLRRSPAGAFSSGESVDPRWVAWVMAPAGLADFEPPGWLRALKPLLCALVSTDNLDYVRRDAYMCGVAAGPVDIARLRHYLFIHDGSLVLHQHGSGALAMFLNARLFLYNNIYFHRTVRRIDLHLRPVFADTVAGLMPPGDALAHLDTYQELTDWSLLAEVERLQRHPRNDAERRLGDHWAGVTSRELPWRLAYEDYEEVTVLGDGLVRTDGRRLAERIRAGLPARWRSVGLEVDVATTDPRPVNPFTDDRVLGLYDPIRKAMHRSGAVDLLTRLLPLRTTILRVYTDNPAARDAVRAATERARAEPAGES